MLPNYIKDLLDLEDVIITKIVHADKYVKFFLDTKPKPHICPVCGNSTAKIHDYRWQTIKDLPFQLKNCYLVLHKRRYVCSCGKKFYESYEFLPRYLHRTKRLTWKIAELLHETVSLKSVAKTSNVSVTTVCRILDSIHYSCPPLKESVSIDEFKGNARTGKYQCILVNPKDHSIMDILPDRTQSHLTSYFREIDRAQRLRVKYFVCDMWQPYVDLAHTFFPNAKVCIDKYHFIRQVTWDMENVRKRLQKTMTVTMRKYYKRSHKLLLTRYHKLKEENKKACDLMLLYNDDLRLAHWLKEKFYEICQDTKYSRQRRDFHDWIKIAESSGLKEFEKCADTYRRWSKEILNAFKYGITNGTTEGFNNKIKVLKRTSYGIRNFERFRTRILHSTN
ncbi:MAG: ISL3 family transposase [Oliverpabstia sp.]|nr:ISL3 family transposase [Oliverpabstia sp.]